MQVVNIFGMTPLLPGEREILPYFCFIPKDFRTIVIYEDLQDDVLKDN